jgi:hypothetical protein
VEKLLDRLETLLVGLSVLVLIGIFGGALTAGVLAWIYGGWAAGLVALFLPVATLTWFAWDALGVRTLADARFRLRRLAAR